MDALKILHLEDSSNDAELIAEQLLSDQMVCEITLVSHQADYLKQLENHKFDIILSDYHLPDINGQEALAHALESQPQTPFILISGLIDDEKAVDIIRQGATDYILKDHLSKLSEAVRRAIEEALIRKLHGEQMMIQNEIITLSKVAYFKLDHQGYVTYFNDCLLDIAAQVEQDDAPFLLGDLLSEQNQQKLAAYFSSHQKEFSAECQIFGPENSSAKWVRLHINRQAVSASQNSYIGSMIDISDIKKTEKKLERKVLELQLIHQGTLVVSNAKSVNLAFQHCIDMICRILQWPIGHVYVPDNKSQQFKSAKIWHIDHFTKAEAFITLTENTAFQKGEGMIGKIWEAKSPCWIRDITQAEFFCRKKPGIDLNIRSAVGLPILVDNHVIAILEFFSYEIENVDQAILDIFATLSRHIGHVFEKKIIEKKLEELAHFDMVTGLPNRAFFNENLRQRISKASRNNSQLALLYLDVDNFKNINDAYGHHYGDGLLKCVTETLRQCIRDCDYIARIGGDEFAVILDQIPSPEVASNFAARLLKAFDRPIIIQNIECKISMSIGIAIYPRAGTNQEELLSHADSAMYQAKSLGKNTFSFYTEALNEQNKRRFSIEKNLQTALLNNELSLLYQPQVSLKTNTICGVEALVRWHSKRLGQVPPDEFIQVAEDSGLIHEIGLWIFKTATEQLESWMQILPDKSPFIMHINCSSLQLQDNRFIEYTKNYMLEHPNLKGRVGLEVTETTLMQHIESVAAQLNKLSQLGIQFAIDDFGTGYSSLSYLKQLPISTLKIDKSFVLDTPNDANDIAIVNAIVKLASALGLKTVAEGVETQAQQELLDKIGCRYAQGYLFAKPQTAEQVNQWIHNGLILRS
jgi:diguanylate cyclase (GGDEF)-like protein